MGEGASIIMSATLKKLKALGVFQELEHCTQPKRAEDVLRRWLCFPGTANPSIPRKAAGAVRR
jgi:hypothetical protein